MAGEDSEGSKGRASRRRPKPASRRKSKPVVRGNSSAEPKPRGRAKPKPKPKPKPKRRGRASLPATPRRARTRTRSRARLDAPADIVWALIGPFESLARWHPLVKSCRLARPAGEKHRRIRLRDGRRIVNRETARDEAGRSYSYGIVEAPVPVSGYSSTLKVLPRAGSACLVEWESSFTPLPGVRAAVARRMVESLVRPGLAALVRRFGGE